MPSTLVTAATFPLLEARLLKDIRETAEADPMMPRWVVVPSATLANHLRVRLANTARKTTFAGAAVVAGIDIWLVYVTKRSHFL